MKDLIESISKGYKPSSTDRNLLTGDEKDQIHLLILFTSERGLCGGFNSIVTRTLRDKIEKLIDQNKTVKIVCVGKKGYDILKRQYSEMITEVIDMREVKSITYQDAKNISDKVVKMFFDGEFDKCSIFYNEFKSVISQIPTEQQVIPIEIISEEADEEKKEESFFEFEPGESEILDEILPLNFTVQVFKALLESAASEQGARMSAMDNASRNAGDMIDNLTLFYNRSRQAVITKELIEIISGAEAV
jgi:F-type H+-transporting ATPase subunit gamma